MAGSGGRAALLDDLRARVGRLERRALPAGRAAAAPEMAARFAFLDAARRMILVTGHRRESLDGGLARIAQGLLRLAARHEHVEMNRRHEAHLS